MVFSGQSQASPPAKHDATSEKWEYYASDEENTEYSYNAGTVERHGNTVKVWVQAKYSEKNLKYSDGRFQWEIDCQKKQMRGLQAYAKKKDGTSAVVTESSDWAIIPSESTAETLYEKVCKKPAQKTDKKAADKKSKEKQAEKKAP
jgi:S-adenosylmethionine hydrolase